MRRFLFDIDPIEFASIGNVVSQLNKWRQRIQNVGRALSELPFLDGVWIRDISLTAATATKINHKLGRKPRGWILTKPTTTTALLGNDLTIYETTSDARTITLRASNTCTVDIWFF